MSLPTVLLYRWYLDATGPNPRAICEQLVNGVAVLVVSSPKVLHAAESFYVSKQYNGDIADAVWLTFFAEQANGAALVNAVTPYLEHVPTLPPVLDNDEDAMCTTVAAPYRRAMTDVTGIALELHTGDLEQHRSFVRRHFARGRHALREHLRQHSKVYRTCCPTPTTEKDFWRAFDRPGPVKELPSIAGHWLENLVAY